MNKMLLIVDPQIDFITGSLPVPGAEEAMNGLAGYIDAHGSEYIHIAVTADCHPMNHCSFDINGGQWPRHCVEGSVGAAVWPALMESLYRYAPEVTLHYKGRIPDREEYSILMNDDEGHRLDEIIASKSIDRIDICGIAGDVCVASTLHDTIGRWGSEKLSIMPQFSPSLDGGACVAGLNEALLNDKIKKNTKITILID